MSSFLYQKNPKPYFDKKRKLQKEILEFINKYLRTKRLNREDFLEIVVKMYRLHNSYIEPSVVKQWIHRDPNRVILDLLMHLNHGDGLLMDQKKSIQVIMNTLQYALNKNKITFWYSSKFPNQRNIQRLLQKGALESINQFLKNPKADHIQILKIYRFGMILNTIYGCLDENSFININGVEKIKKKIKRDVYGVILDVLMVLNYGDNLLDSQKVAIKHIVNHY